MAGLYETSNAYKEQLEEELEEEKQHSAFLEKLVAALYGEGWTMLTLNKAKEWRKLWLKRI